MEHVFVLNIILTLVWMAITAEISVENGFFGFFIGAMVLFLIRHHFSNKDYMKRVWAMVKLSFLFVYELCLSALRVSYIIIFRVNKHHTVLVAYPLRVKDDFQIMLLANMITLTPGTLSVDVCIDKEFLYIHTLDSLDKEALCKDIHDGFEEIIIEAFQ